MNELGAYLLVQGGYDSKNISLDLRTLPGRPAQRDAINERARELKERLSVELGWPTSVATSIWSPPALSVTPQLTDEQSLDERGQAAQHLEMVLDEEDLRTNSLSLIDWITEPARRLLPSPWGRLSPDEHQTRYEKVRRLRESYIEPYYAGRHPIKYPDVYAEFYEELSALEHELVSHLIRVGPRTSSWGVRLISRHDYSPELQAAARERLLALGWMVKSPEQYSHYLQRGELLYLRRGKSTLFSATHLLRE